MGGQLPQRDPRVGHGYQRQVRIGLGPAMLDHGTDGTGSEHIAHELVTVEAVALEGDEQHARCHRTRIGADRQELGIPALRENADRRRGLVQLHHHACRPPSTDCATSRSENGWRTPAIS
jgi:hypothetical protein